MRHGRANPAEPAIGPRRHAADDPVERRCAAEDDESDAVSVDQVLELDAEPGIPGGGTVAALRRWRHALGGEAKSLDAVRRRPEGEEHGLDIAAHAAGHRDQPLAVA